MAAKGGGRLRPRKIGWSGVETLAALENFLAEAAWAERFDDEVRGLGAKLIPKVRGLRLDEGDGETCFSADVLGHSVEGAFWEEAGGLRFETACDCEAGVFCEHGFAALGKLAKERKLGRLFGRGAREAVNMELAAIGGAEAAEEPDGEPAFSLRVKKGEVDKPTKLLLQSLGEKKPGEWIYGEAAVNYGNRSIPLPPSGGNPAEMRAVRELRDAGLSSMKSNPAWRFLLSMKSRTTDLEGSDKWFPDPGRVPVDAF